MSCNTRRGDEWKRENRKQMNQSQSDAYAVHFDQFQLNLWPADGDAHVHSFYRIIFFFGHCMFCVSDLSHHFIILSIFIHLYLCINVQRESVWRCHFPLLLMLLLLLSMLCAILCCNLTKNKSTQKFQRP